MNAAGCLCLENELTGGMCRLKGNESKIECDFVKAFVSGPLHLKTKTPKPYVDDAVPLADFRMYSNKMNVDAGAVS